MSNYGIKFAKPNIDVTTAQDKDLCYSSDFKTFKIYRVMRFTEIGSQLHGLSYAPTFFIPQQGVAPFVLADRPYGFNFIKVDAESVYCYDMLGKSEIYVILMADPLNE